MSIKNALIHALGFVVKMLIAKLYIICQFVPVEMATLAIRIAIATKFHMIVSHPSYRIII